MFQKILMILVLFSTLFARVDDYISQSNLIQNLLLQSVRVYEKGDFNQAKEIVEKAYFQHFEEMEGPIGRNIGRKAFVMEKKFTTLRKMYGEQDNIHSIRAIVDGLIEDLKEVAPILQSGFKMQAQASEENLSEEELMQRFEQVQKNQQSQADDLIAQILQEENTNSKETKINDLQSLQALPPRLQQIYEQISIKFDRVLYSLKNQDNQTAKESLQSILFDDYRNTKLETLISRYTQSGNDQKIQQSIRRLIIMINNEVSYKEIRNYIESTQDEFLKILAQIPLQEIHKLKGFQEIQERRDYTNIAKEIRDSLNKVLEKSQHSDVAIALLQSTYLDIFESSGMESKIGAVDARLKFEIEGYFSKGVALIKSHASKEEIEKNFEQLNLAIESSLEKITESNPISLLIWSLGIILREGLEALIIIVAIASYLVQSNNQRYLSIVYSSISAGVLLSFITAFILSWIIKENAGRNRELIEGITMLVAVSVLFYVGFWFLSQAQNKKWANYIQTQVSYAISERSKKILWFSIFLSVYREGAESVLFYQALLFDAQTSLDFASIFAGLGIGMLVLVGLYFLLKARAIKVSTQKFFYFTSYLIFYMIFVFTGKGVVELIEGKIVSPTSFPLRFDAISWLGIYPYYETLTPQFVILILLSIGIFIMHQKKHNKGRKNEKNFV